MPPGPRWQRFKQEGCTLLYTFVYRIIKSAVLSKDSQKTKIELDSNKEKQKPDITGKNVFNDLNPSYQTDNLSKTGNEEVNITTGLVI